MLRKTVGQFVRDMEIEDTPVLLAAAVAGAAYSIAGHVLDFLTRFLFG